jgi:DNA-directed RNA polymerase alpha subunit
MVGDLVKRTEAELLGCKNFGMMSLSEIKRCLQEKGLELRTLDD